MLACKLIMWWCKAASAHVGKPSWGRSLREQSLWTPLANPAHKGETRSENWSSCRGISESWTCYQLGLPALDQWAPTLAK